jgi:integrase
MKGYIRKKGKKWSFTVDIGRDPITGKRKQKTRSGFDTKKEAQAALAELVNSVEKGEYYEPRKKTFKEFARDYFEKTYINRVKPTTFDRSTSLLEKQILPYFKNIQLKDMDQFVIGDFYQAKLKEGLSASYIQRMHELLRMLLIVAKKWELIQKDVAGMIEAPKIKKKEMEIWTIEQVNQYLKHTKHSRYHPIFFLAAYTGMRKGEMLALSWDDINLDEKYINISKTLYKITNEYVVNEPKTASSIRKIYFDDDIERVLKKQRVKQNLEKLKNGGVYQDNNLVFAQEDGGYVNPSAVNQLFLRFIRQINVPRIRFHDLRHTHATILLQMGVNPKLVADRLGHSSVKITLDVYSHVTKDMRSDTTELFTKAMKSGTESIRAQQR